MRLSRKVATSSALAAGGLVVVHLLAAGKFLVLASLFGGGPVPTVLSVAVGLLVMGLGWVVHRRRRKTGGGKAGWTRTKST